MIKSTQGCYLLVQLECVRSFKNKLNGLPSYSIYLILGFGEKAGKLRDRSPKEV